MENASTIPAGNPIALQARDITERFVRASGPGGQNVRHESTAVELRVDIRRSSLPLEVQTRLMALSGRHVTKDGVLIVRAGALRSLAQNRAAAHTRLATLVTRAATPSKERTLIEPRALDPEARIAEKKQRGAIKRARR